MTSVNKYSFFNLSDSEKDLNNSIILPTINSKTQINDSRKLKDFKIQTFGGYSKSQLLSNIDKAISEDKLDTSVQYGFQLLLSGCVNQLWDKLIIYCCKHINTANPKLPLLLLNRNSKWYNITTNSKFTRDSILLLRNHPEIRNMLVELISIACISKKRKLEPNKKIKNNDFIIDNFKKKLESDNSNLINRINKQGDPSEMKIAVNEMGFHILKGNYQKAIYWLNWILEWERGNIKKYKKYDCAYRKINGVDAKYCSSVIWLIWEMIIEIKKIKFSNNPKINEQIGSLWQLYIYRYSPSQKSKKNNFLIWAICYLVYNIDWKIPLIDRPHIVLQSILNQDKLINNMKSQQVNNHLLNSQLMNIAVKNNYIVPEKHKQYQKEKEKMIMQRQKALINKKKEQELKLIKQKELEAKRKKINIESLDKLNALNSIDQINFY